MNTPTFLARRWAWPAPASVALAIVATFLAGCAGTSVRQTWTSPDFHRPVGRIATLAVIRRAGHREGYENRLTQQLEKSGAAALPTFNFLPLEQIKADKAAAANLLTGRGAGALLILRVVDRDSSYREYRVGPERWGAVGTGFDTVGWYDYYTLGFTDISPTYGSLKEQVDLEAALYDLKSEKRLWSVITRTVIKDDTDRPAAVDRLVEKIVDAMVKDGVVP